MTLQQFTFADLFAGIGGFHAALHAAGGRCEFASEIDAKAALVYERNWAHRPAGDIVPLTDPDVKVPPVDVLAAGFPCQPFSKSGFQRGIEETRGTLFFNIAKVLQARQPPVIVLENVRNLAGPRQRATFDTIVETLRDLGYRVPGEPAVLSPHTLPPSRGGRPQVRERVFIMGTYVGRAAANTPEARRVSPLSTGRDRHGWDPRDWHLDEHLLQPDNKIAKLHEYILDDDEVAAIDKWNELLRGLVDPVLPGFPIWADELRWPAVIPAGCPDWKRSHLLKNADLYRRNARHVDRWRGGDSPEDAPHLTGLVGSWRKLEWQAGQPGMGAARDLWRTVMHFRPSGIRAKRPDYLPALVAITQTSIIGPRRRRITPREAARLQGLPDWFEFFHPASSANEDEPRQKDPASYKQLGNGVNVGAAYWMLRKHIERDADLIRVRAPHLVDAWAAAPTDPDEGLRVRPQAAHPASGLVPIDLTVLEAIDARNAAGL